ncbi:MAG: N-acetylglucosamine-6-phosphate deacetylase [Clostridiales bacterium]|nr:N-acetylglucosamine-6-phosphate deacetylase [Clostridiales bacterium]
MTSAPPCRPISPPASTTPAAPTRNTDIFNRRKCEHPMLIINARAFIDGQFMDEASVRIENGVITAAGSAGNAGNSPRAEKNEEIKDIGGDFLLPGFVDVHTHAYGGHDTMEGEEAVRHMSREYGRLGVAAFLPTTMSASPEETRFALKGIRGVMEKPEPDGALVMGAHMEAPFLNPEKCGAQRSECFLLPSPDIFEREFGAYADIVRLITVAPELPGAGDFIRYAAEHGIHVSAGHTCADAETVHRAADLGLDHSTHTFNAQPALHHRAPGCTGAVLTDDRIWCEMICDGMHLHPDTVRMILRCKGKEKAVAVTDSMEAAGMPDGEYALGGQKVFVRGGKAALAGGTLAGSTLTMQKAFTNMLSWGIPAEIAACACTSAPADSAGLERAGRIAPGRCGILTRWSGNWEMTEVVR